MTGKHVIPWAYSGEGGADAILAQHGGLEGAVTSVLGEPAEELKPGCVVLWRIVDDVGLGISIGFDKIVVLTKGGRLHELSADYVDVAW